MPRFVTRRGTYELPHFHRWEEREEELRAARRPLVGPTTKIATIGSCFAKELAAGLHRFGISGGGMHPGGLFYTSASIRQELEHLWNESRVVDDEPLHEAAEGWLDPLRSPSDAEPDREALRARRRELDREARRLFASPDVIVVTLGLIEAWMNPESGCHYRVIPHPDVFDSVPVTLHRLSVSEIEADLARIRELVQRHTSAQLILTVSPIPLHATFTDQDVRIANIESKSRIRAAVSQFVEAHPDVHYFHSFEIVTAAEPPSDFMKPDGRHVHRDGVDCILEGFLRTFGTDGLGPHATPTRATLPERAGPGRRRTPAWRRAVRSVQRRLTGST